MTYAPHGEKRPHEDDVDNTQRLTKRFHLLDLGIEHHMIFM